MYQFFMPTKIIMAEDCIRNNAEQMKSFGHRAFIVTGANSAKSSGALQDIIEALDSLGISYEIYDKIKSNPTIASVYDAAAIAKEKKSDFVIGIGGGSPMDAAKAIALLATQDLDEERLFSGNYEAKALPIVAVPTTAGTGSEVTQYSILTNDKKQTKTSISSPALFPRIAFLDAKYTMNLPMQITINTALDALSHAIEGMLTVRASLVTDALALESISRISQCLRYLSPLKEIGAGNQLSGEVREKLLCGSMLAGIVIAHTGTTAVHSMGYCLTYFKNVDHGRANALILPSFLRAVAKSEQETITRILNAMGLTSMDDFEAILLRLLGERESITQKDLERYTSIAIQAKNVSNSRLKPDRECIENIYARSLQIIY
jgi:alcohol dehydrogenase class IV